MTTTRIPILATAFGSCMVGMVSLLLCLLLWFATGNPVWHAALPLFLSDYPRITLLGVVRGVVVIGLIGIYAGSVFAIFFNLWTSVSAALFRRG